MKVTFLGTGTSQGVPVINCDCAVCQSENSKNKRLRTSITVQKGDTCILIDTSPDLRTQLLRYPIPRLDAVLFTHTHADHIYGIDDVRRFNQIQKNRIPAFTNANSITHLKRIFEYAFDRAELNLGLPNLVTHEITGPFEINGLLIQPVKLKHGRQEILGFRMDDFAYCTDVSGIPAESYPLLEGLDVLVLGALRLRPHPTHFSLEEAVAEAEKIKAKQTYLVHMSHAIDHEIHGQQLPPAVNFAYDGLSLDINDGGPV